MPWTLGLAVYFVIWWTILFAILPFGIKSQHEAGDIVPGSEPGAPVRPQLLKRMLWNTVVSAVIWVGVNLAYVRYYLGQ